MKTVGIILPNCIEYPVIVAGCLHAGLTVTTVNPAYTVSEIAHQLQAAKADVLFADSQNQDKVGSGLFPDCSLYCAIDILDTDSKA